MRKYKTNRQVKYDRNDQIIVNIVMDYFDEENLGSSDTWRETLLRYRIYKMFDRTIYKSPKDKEWDFNEAITDLRTVLPELKKILRTIKTPEGDGTIYEAGEADYGNFCYVSDRWFCQFRLEWLIDLAERNWTYKKVVTTEMYKGTEISTTEWEPYKDGEFYILRGKEVN